MALVTPYMRPLVDQVADTIRGEGFEVTDLVALAVSDNVEVGRLAPHGLPAIVRELDLGSTDAFVLSACVQMPSLPVVQQVQEELGIPVLTAATATARAILLALGFEPTISHAATALAVKPASLIAGGFA